MADDKPIKQNTIERSKSARASCKDCGGVIGKGEPRFCLVDFAFSEHGSYKYFHIACANRRKPRELAQLMAEKGDELEVPRAEIEALMSGASAPAAPAGAASSSRASSSKRGASAAASSEPVTSAPPIAAHPDWLTKIKTKGEMPAWADGVGAPRTKDGHVLDEAATTKLVMTMKADIPSKPSPHLDEFDAWLDPVSLRDFTWRIFEKWARESGHMRDKWLFRSLGRTLDDAGAMRLSDVLEGWIKGNRKPAAEAGLEMLESLGTQSALLVIQGLSQRFHYKGGYNIAAQALARVAKSRDMTVDELEDWLVPTLGLDENGSRIFDYGPRKFELRVSNELRVEVVMEDGKSTLRGLPPSRQSDDLAKVDSSKRAFELLKAELEKTLRVQSRRLELALSSGRLWDPEKWAKYLWKHPVLKHLVRRLVWGTYDQGDKPALTFTVDESGELMNVDLEKIELPENRIGLIHPAELDEDVRARWGTVLSDFEIIQPFLQLGRAVRKVPASDASGDALRDYPKSPIGPGPLHGVLNRAGYIKAMPDDMRVMHFYKRFEAHGVTGVIQLDPGLWVSGGDDPQTASEAFFIRQSSPDYNTDRLSLTDVGLVPISEVLSDLEALASAGDATSDERGM